MPDERPHQSAPRVALSRLLRGVSHAPAQAPPHSQPRSAPPLRPAHRSRSAGWQAELYARLLLARHGAMLLRGRLLRWRLETFGLYAPSLPQARPWWRVNGSMALLLLRRRGHYARWLAEMHALRSHGAEGWWQETGRDTARALQAYVEQTNRDEENIV